MCKFIANGFLIQTMYFELLLSQQKLGTFFENKVLEIYKKSNLFLIKVGLMVQYFSKIFFEIFDQY